MVTGVIYKNSCCNNDLIFKKLNSEVDWPNAQKIEINFELFKGMLFIDNRLPYKAEDFFKLDRNAAILLIAFGKIYNKEEICKKYKIRSTLTDPEVLLKLFIELKDDFVCELNGDFIIFVYQPFNDLILLIRDHLGVRPLAYIDNPDGLWFSTDILSLCKVFHKNNPIVVDYLIRDLKLVDNILTPNPEVKKIKPGHYLKSESGIIRIKKYWFPENIKVNKKLNFIDSVKNLEPILQDAIRIRCDSRLTELCNFFSVKL